MTSRWLPAHRAARGLAITDVPVWERRDMRQALAARDVGMVYRLLQSHGVSQRRIAAATDQTQSEISEILAGRRVVVAYDLLSRIADGLEIPRGRMGLAYDDATAALVGGTEPTRTRMPLHGDPPWWWVCESLGQ